MKYRILKKEEGVFHMLEGYFSRGDAYEMAKDTNHRMVPALRAHDMLNRFNKKKECGDVPPEQNPTTLLAKRMAESCVKAAINEFARSTGVMVESAYYGKEGDFEIVITKREKT